MRPTKSTLPLLPLVLDRAPGELAEMLAQAGVPFCRREEEPWAGQFVLFDSRRGQLETGTEGQTCIDIDALRRGAHGDPLAACAEARSARFEWRVGPWTLSEEIARVDRRAVRRRVLESLRGAVEAAGGVWLSVSAYPFPYRSAFNFRIDHDRYDAGDFRSTMEALAGHEDCTSHFVTGAEHEAADEVWARLCGLDVGSHGYWHHTYRTVEENVQNIGRGIEVLRRAGIEPRGFAAPHGRYSAALGAAMTELGISHSGEFGLAYDDLPFYPSLDGPLEIPVHPVCVGLFLEAADRRGADEAITLDDRRRDAATAAGDYFERLIAERYHTGEPIVLYGHPDGRLGRYPDVLRRALRAVDSLPAVWRTTQSNWERWWRARRRLRLSVTEEQGQYAVMVAGRTEGERFALEYWRGPHVAVMPMDGPVVRFSPAALAYENRRPERAVRPVRVTRAEGIKSHLRRAIDWERVTPPEEIGTRGWRNRIKRTLRKWMVH